MAAIYVVAMSCHFFCIDINQFLSMIIAVSDEIDRLSSCVGCAVDGSLLSFSALWRCRICLSFSKSKVLYCVDCKWME